MTTKINSKTTLKQIKGWADSDFGIKITNSQAKEIREAVRRGCAAWDSERYISTVSSDDVVRMSRSGVQFSAYKTFYSRQEWNEAVASGRFN